MATQNFLIRGLGLGFRLWKLLVVTIVLQLGMLPLMASDFHRITLAGPFANLIAVPLTGVLVPTGFLTLISSFVFPSCGRLLAIPITWLAQALFRVVHWFADLPHWSYRIPSPAHALVVAFLLSIIAIALAFRFQNAPARALRGALAAAILVMAAIIATCPFAPVWQHGMLEVSVLDVGQGDSIFVVSPRGRTLLIDAGGAFAGFPGSPQGGGTDPYEEAVSTYLWSRRFQSLDIVALTHAHLDHLGGLNAVLENFRIGKLWIGREVASTALAGLESLARRKGVTIEYETSGQKMLWDGVEAEFLWPEQDSGRVATTAKNDDSVVLRLSLGNKAIMLPGDAKQQAERQILAKNAPESLRSDVLKVGYHGSRNSSTAGFLSAVQPHFAIVSAGADNPYGHPNHELLERLENAGVRVLRTDCDGAVHVVTNGKTLEMRCFVSCPDALSPTERQADITAREEDR